MNGYKLYIHINRWVVFDDQVEDGFKYDLLECTSPTGSRLSIHTVVEILNQRFENGECKCISWNHWYNGNIEIELSENTDDSLKAFTIRASTWKYLQVPASTYFSEEISQTICYYIFWRSYFWFEWKFKERVVKYSKMLHPFDPVLLLAIFHVTFDNVFNIL